MKSIKTLLKLFEKRRWVSKKKSTSETILFYGESANKQVGEVFRVKERFAGQVEKALKKEGYEVSWNNDEVAVYKPKGAK